MAPTSHIQVDKISSTLHPYNNTPAADRVAIAARSLQTLRRHHPTAAKITLVVVIFVVASFLAFVFIKGMRRSLRPLPGTPVMRWGHVYGRGESVGSYALGSVSAQERSHHEHVENRTLDSGAVSGGSSTASVARPVPVVTRAPEGRDWAESPPPPCKQLPFEPFIACDLLGFKLLPSSTAHEKMQELSDIIAVAVPS